MDRDKNSIDNLLERKNILIAELMTSFRDLINHGAAQVDSTASTGQAGYTSMALEISMNGLIKSTEDLLTLTRQLRELWVVGPLKAPGAHDAEAEEAMQRDAGAVFVMLNGRRDGERQRLLQRVEADGGGGGLKFERGPVDGIPPRAAAASAADAVGAHGQVQS